jgi:hypothetical protein
MVHESEGMLASLEGCEVPVGILNKHKLISPSFK